MSYDHGDDEGSQSILVLMEAAEAGDAAREVDAHTPTEVDTEAESCADTIIDHSSADGDENGAGGAGGASDEWDDAVWDLIGGRPTVPSPMAEESYDSQATDAEDPNYPVQNDPSLQAAEHWSLKENFVRSVNEIVDHVQQFAWLRHVVFAGQSLVDFEACVQAAAQHIHTNVLGSAWRFKVGITENPAARWSRPDCGYAHDGWSFMDLIYVAPTSKWRVKSQLEQEHVKALKLSSTGSMERRLVQIFHDHPDCINTQRGGRLPIGWVPTFCICGWPSVDGLPDVI